MIYPTVSFTSLVLPCRKEGKFDTKNTILCFKLSVLSIIQVKTHEKMNKVPYHSASKIWDFLASKFWTRFEWSAHQFRQTCCLMKCKFQPTFSFFERLSWGHLFELQVFNSKTNFNSLLTVVLSFSLQPFLGVKYFSII